MRLRTTTVPRPIAAVLLCTPSLGWAQEDRVREEIPDEEPFVDASLGVTFTSRLIYRGQDLGDSPQIQPRISFNMGDLELSLWAPHPYTEKPFATFGFSL